MISTTAFAVTPPTEDLMKIGVGARPMGMGKAFVAVADDGDSIFINPAGLAGMKNWEFTSMYVNMLEGDVPYTVLSGSIPLKNGNNLGLGLIATGTSNIPSPGPQSISYFDYYDRLFFLSLAGNMKKNVQLGGNLKLFSKGFTGGDNNTGFGIDADLGIKYFHNDWLTFGANLQNLAPFPLMWRSSAADDIPAIIKLGTAAKVLQKKLTLALDVDYPAGRNIPSVFHLGAEWPATEIFSLRVGADQIVSAANNVSTNPTAGIGLNFQGFRLDYAYHPYQESDMDIAQYVSFSYSPPPAKIVPPPPPKKVEKKPPMFIDVPDGYWAKEAIEALATMGIVSGYPDRTFKPEGEITRAELAVILMRVKGNVARTYERKFKDVRIDHWAADYINLAADSNVVQGFPDGTFRPANNVTRAEGLAMIARFANIAPEAPETIGDVDAGHWISPLLGGALKAGMLRFLQGQPFEPDRALTRAEAAEILYRSPALKKFVI